MSNDIFSTLRVYLSKVSEGEHTPAEVLASINGWLRETGETIKTKIEEEVERAIAKAGFVKQSEFDELKKEVEALRASDSTPKKPATKKTVTKKTAEPKAKVVKKAAVKGVKK